MFKPKSGIIAIIMLIFILPALHGSTWGSGKPQQEESQQAADQKVTLLKLLELIPSPESIDYLQNKTRFQLHPLPTEQRHPKTWNLSDRMIEDIRAGLGMLFSVEEDIAKRLASLGAQKGALDQAAKALEEAICTRKKIFIYGCAKTGRAAKLIESAMWRRFWREAKKRKKIWSKVEDHLGKGIEERLIGGMPGADGGLIDGVAVLEDVRLLGRLQLEDWKIEPEDVVLCVSASGETPWVIGAMQAALDQWKKVPGYTPEKAKKKLYFITNNPEENLLPYDRSREVIEEPGITKIYLTTGPQAIAGATGMQASTTDTFVIGHTIQKAVDQTLQRFLSNKEMAKLGFEEPVTLQEKFQEYAVILRQARKRLPELSSLIALEAETCKNNHFSAYFAQKGLLAALINQAETRLTFSLSPLETVADKKRRNWRQVLVSASDPKEAWQVLLGRKFRELPPSFLKASIQEEIVDPSIRTKILESQKKAVDNQQIPYDFFLSDSKVKNHPPQNGDLGVLVVVTPEEPLIKNKKSDFRIFIRNLQRNGARTALLFITDKPEKELAKVARKIPASASEEIKVLAAVHIDFPNDPFGVNQQTALKIILDAHSTAVMSRLGKVVGNTVTHLNLSHLKNIDRATSLIQSHVNDVLIRPQWVKKYGIRQPISYGEANAVLYEACSFLSSKVRESGHAAAADLSIVQILESLRQKQSIDQEDALDTLQERGLRLYLRDVTSEKK
jgi:hypothetical protein